MLAASIATWAETRSNAIATELLDENVQTILGAAGRDTFRLRQDDHAVQRAPQNFRQKYRLLPVRPERGDKRLEGGAKG